MQSYPSLALFWQAYFQPTSTFDTWTIVLLRTDAGDALITLANPLTEQQQDVLIESTSTDELQLFAQHYKQRFTDQLPQRFTHLRPEVSQVLTEYPDWLTFQASWLTGEPQQLQANWPLLFDFPSVQQYRALQLKQIDYAGYQRLLVVIYQYRKQRFLRIFIKNVDDAQLIAIRHQVEQAFTLAMPELITAS